MEQGSAQLCDDDNPPCKPAGSGVLVRVPLLVARSFEGLAVVGVPRRRRILTGDPDPETASGDPAFPLQVRHVNRAEPPSHEDEASPHTTGSSTMYR
jgi:hypothetical protein